MRLSKNSNDLGNGTIGDMLKRINPDMAIEPVVVKTKMQEESPKVLELPKSEQLLSRHRIAGGHHNSAPMGSTGWIKQTNETNNSLDEMIKRLQKS